MRVLGARFIIEVDREVGRRRPLPGSAGAGSVGPHSAVKTISGVVPARDAGTVPRNAKLAVVTILLLS